MAHVPDPSASGSSEVFALLQAVVALALVAGLAVLCLRWFGRRGFGRAQSSRFRIEERMALDPRNGLLLVNVEGRRLLLATNDTAPARLIAELAPDSAPASAASTARAARASGDSAP